MRVKICQNKTKHKFSSILLHQFHLLSHWYIRFKNIKQIWDHLRLSIFINSMVLFIVVRRLAAAAVEDFVV